MTWSSDKNKPYRISDCWSKDKLSFDFLEKEVGLVSAPHFEHGFFKKNISPVYCIYWPNFMMWFLWFLFFSLSIRVFFHRHWRLTGQQGKGGDHLLFHSTTSTRSRTFRHLFVTLHVRWLSHIFNRTACIYQAATRWDLPPYRITIWLTDDVTLSFCLFTWWFDSSFFFLLQQFKTGNRWIRTRIDYHPGITSEPTNQVC